MEFRVCEEVKMQGYDLKELIYELFQYRRVYSEETSEFSNCKHNSVLCPTFQQKIESVVNSLDKYRKITYDMQGVNDRGTDILLRLTENDDTQYICFQIKSEDDLKNNDYLRILKAQYFDTMEKYGHFEDYYIILCCNSSDKRNKSKIRNIEAEMSKQSKINIIEPEYALSFIRLGNPIIDAFIKNKLSDNDIVFRKALDIINDLTPSEMAVLFFIIYSNIYLKKEYVSKEEILNSIFIQEIYNSVPDYSRGYFFEDTNDSRKVENYSIDYEVRNLDIYTRLTYDLDYLSNNFLGLNYDNNYKIMIEEVYPIIVIMIDGNIRYGYESIELLRYLMNIRLSLDV